MPSRRPTVATLTYRDGSTNPVRIYRGAPTGAPCVILWPGLNVPAAYFDELAFGLVDAGYNAVASEQRGQGSARPQVSAASRFGYQQMASEDYPSVAALARQKFPDSPRIVLGHSMGGLIGSMYAARARNNIAGLVLVASGTGYHRLEPPLAGAARLIGTGVAARTAAARGHWAGTSIDGFGPQARGVIRDFDHLVRTGRFDVEDADIDYDARLAALGTPVLAVAIEGDRAVSAAQVRGLASKFPARSTTVQTVPGRLGHNHWILHPEVMVPVFDEWIRSIVPGPTSRG
ncbi:alpha/beta fold hydrolase [Tsukamurella sp. 8F]|uniref:alpha/beta fold hydrolase n=1 Tax=unclassified Tsukamurella TaxID=2633480 RepID=UPI0023BA0E0C|nr:MULTISPECIES: alpha/beta fold hydrolase [unclassified Tsukamurella]MDF0532561.1 alpha/beta fold hydrolase [Tsukamurella sp. 8J]MDF0585898.1 alpha/beta fold hydrolase [Tsukamurella sp. 8F]